MTAPEPLHFYFDFISPFGYFASLRIDALAARHGRIVQWHPMLLGVSVMKVMGLKPLLDTPLKGPYTANDVRRYARLHGITLGRATNAPMMNPLTAGRAFAWARQHRPDAAKALAQAMLHAYWHDGIDLSEPAALLAIHIPPQFSATVSAAELITAAQSPEAAQLLRGDVEASLKAGVFGSPTVVVDGEVFWGVDKLEQVETWLQRGGW
jgi:2-hydroxychromene-2-carboxylate isomerase